MTKRLAICQAGLHDRHRFQIRRFDRVDHLNLVATATDDQTLQLGLFRRACAVEQLPAAGRHANQRNVSTNLHGIDGRWQRTGVAGLDDVIHALPSVNALTAFPTGCLA